MFVKAIEVGGRHLDERVAQELSMELTQAQALRRHLITAEHSQLDNQLDSQLDSQQLIDPEQITAVGQALRPTIDQLGREIGLCLRYCAVTFRGQRCDSVTCIGGEALSNTLLEQLSEAIGVSARRGRIPCAT